MRRFSKFATIAALAGVGAVTMAVGVFAPAGAAQSVLLSAQDVDELPPFAVEDFNYPQADQILAERGFLLKRGDGHIVLAECGSGNDLLQVYARNHSDNVCFRITGPEGYLALELPAVFGVRTNGYSTTALDLTVDGEQSTVEVPANTFEAVGESADPQGRDHVLVEIRVTR
jgi:hypothetical protein